MSNKHYLTSLSLLLSAAALTGCATQKAWSPELEEANQTHQAVVADPNVQALASTELERAEIRLKEAQDAQDFYRPKGEVDHKAQLAKLKLLEAQQTARALAAKQNLRLAQAGLPPVVLAAATPSQAPATGQTWGGSEPALAANTASVVAELESLAKQIQMLQHNLQNPGMTTSSDHSMGSDSELLSPAPARNSLVAWTQVELTPDLMEGYVPAKPAESAPTLAAARDLSNNYSMEDAPHMSAPTSVTEIEATTVNQTPRLREALRAMNAQPSDRGMSMALGDRYFEEDSARLWNNRAARHLDNVATLMADNPDLVLEIEAHLDNQGTQEFRDNLTKDRAIAIKSALVIRGIDATRINATGYSDSAPVTGNQSPLGRLQNRRVELIFPNISE